MIAQAHARFIRVSPRKLRQVVDAIRGKSAFEALSILANSNKGARVYAEDLLKSAMSNARRDPNVKDENLFISRISVDGGPVLKRYRAMSMGRAGMIRHRTSHISVELDLLPTRKIHEAKTIEKKARKSRTKKRKA